MNTKEKFVYVRLSHGNEIIRKETLLSKLNSLMELKTLVKGWLNLSTGFTMQRKSKRANTYIKLESLKDFKSLKRSLEVKNTLKLKIIDRLDDNEKSNNDDTIIKPHKSHVKDPSDGLEDTPLNKYDDREVLVKELKNLQLQLQSFQDRLQQEKKHNSEIVYNHTDHDKDWCAHAATAKPKETITAKNSLDVNADVFIDIPFSSMDYKERLVDLVQKCNTAPKLLELSENMHHFEKLMSFVHGDVDALFAIVKDSLGQKSSESNNASDYHVHVDLSVVDSKLRFVLTNNDIWKIPKNMKLVLQILNDNNDVIFTINLFLGDNTMKRRLQRTIQYNLNGIDKSKILNEGYVKLMLIKDDATLYRVGYGKELGLGPVFMREPSSEETQLFEQYGETKKSKPVELNSDSQNSTESPTSSALPASPASPTQSTQSTTGIPPEECGEEDSTRTSKFATPSGSTILIDLSKSVDEKAPPAPTPSSTPVTQSSFEELTNSDITLINRGLVNIMDGPAGKKSTTNGNIEANNSPKDKAEVNADAHNDDGNDTDIADSATGSATEGMTLNPDDTVGNVSSDTEDITDTVGNVSSNTEDITDFSEISESEGMAVDDYDVLSVDDYEILSADDYLTDHDE